MHKQDLEFIADILEQSNLLFYGDWEDELQLFLQQIFKNDLKDFTSTLDSKVAYWLILSKFDELGLIEYGTSPRTAWLTEAGERFRKIILENENAISEAADFIYKKYNSHGEA
jgi:hypothetical protein